MLELDVAVYPTERDWTLFAKQYLVSNTATAWDLFRAAHLGANHTWAAMKKLLYSRVAPTKHCIDVAF